VYLDPDRKLEVALAITDLPYRNRYSYDIQIPRDVFVVDLKTGAKKLITSVQGFPRLSPEGKFVGWFNPQDAQWYAYEIATGRTRVLTAGLQVSFADELHDSPSMASSYGDAGWLEKDAAILVYDRYDIWKLDPTGKVAPINLTNGREQELSFRYLNLDPEERFIPTGSMWMRAFHETTKQSGFYKINNQTGRDLQKIWMEDYNYYGLRKAKNSDRICYRRSTYQEYGDVWVSDLGFASPQRVSQANPQQAGYKWGTVELVNYRSQQGDALQGLLYKPENMVPGKKYPMMVYFYERNSDGLHNYRPPAPSASTINIPLFVSNDYVVFVPDIKYTLGFPGQSAYDCIVPGVNAVVELGFVDEKNMAIQGQSWGGYQVAWLITRTHMFKAAGAGAPVVNMTSAYGGIRWGTGMSRMFQYEQTQSRIGGTLWEKPWHYIDNSPLFMADRVQTPLLMTHNDADGAVPWYQGIEFYMALRRFEKPVWLLVYNGEDHNLVQRKNRKDLSVRLLQFFDHYLKGAPAPVWMEEGVPAILKGRDMGLDIGERK
jgi:dipeptidyl aminopeptidase/acylaminoacyl peptidase